MARRAHRDLTGEHDRWFGETEANQGEVALSLENPDGSWFFRIPRSTFGDESESGSDQA